MDHKTEIKRLVIIKMLEKFPAGMPLTDRHWNICYKSLRADCLIQTLTWKLDNISVTL